MVNIRNPQDIVERVKQLPPLTKANVLEQAYQEQPIDDPRDRASILGNLLTDLGSFAELGLHLVKSPYYLAKAYTDDPETFFSKAATTTMNVPGMLWEGIKEQYKDGFWKAMHRQPFTTTTDVLMLPAIMSLPVKASAKVASRIGASPALVEKIISRAKFIESLPVRGLKTAGNLIRKPLETYEPTLALLGKLELTQSAKEVRNLIGDSFRRASGDVENIILNEYKNLGKINEIERLNIEKAYRGLLLDSEIEAFSDNAKSVLQHFTEDVNASKQLLFSQGVLTREAAKISEFTPAIMRESKAKLALEQAGLFAKHNFTADKFLTLPQSKQLAIIDDVEVILNKAGFVKPVYATIFRERPPLSFSEKFLGAVEGPQTGGVGAKIGMLEKRIKASQDYIKDPLHTIPRQMANQAFFKRVFIEGLNDTLDFLRENYNARPLILEEIKRLGGMTPKGFEIINLDEIVTPNAQTLTGSVQLMKEALKDVQSGIREIRTEARIKRVQDLTQALLTNKELDPDILLASPNLWLVPTGSGQTIVNSLRPGMPTGMWGTAMGVYDSASQAMKVGFLAFNAPFYIGNIISGAVLSAFHGGITPLAIWRLTRKEWRELMNELPEVYANVYRAIELGHAPKGVQNIPLLGKVFSAGEFLLRNANQRIDEFYRKLVWLTSAQKQAEILKFQKFFDSGYSSYDMIKKIATEPELRRQISTNQRAVLLKIGLVSKAVEKIDEEITNLRLKSARKQFIKAEEEIGKLEAKGLKQRLSTEEKIGQKQAVVHKRIRTQITNAQNKIKNLETLRNQLEYNLYTERLRAEEKLGQKEDVLTKREIAKAKAISSEVNFEGRKKRLYKLDKQIDRLNKKLSDIARKGGKEVEILAKNLNRLKTLRDKIEIEALKDFALIEKKAARVETTLEKQLKMNIKIITKEINDLKTYQQKLMQMRFMPAQEAFNRQLYLIRQRGVLQNQYDGLRNQLESTTSKTLQSAFDDAKEAVNKTLFDYYDLPVLERAMARRVFLFYGWFRNLNLLIAKAPFIRTKTTFAWNRIARLAVDIANDPNKPVWLKDYMPIGATENGDQIWINLRVVNPFQGVVTKGFGDVVSRLNPIIQVGFQIVNGRNLFTKKPIDTEYITAYNGVIYRRDPITGKVSPLSPIDIPAMNTSTFESIWQKMPFTWQIGALWDMLSGKRPEENLLQIKPILDGDNKPFIPYWMRYIPSMFGINVKTGAELAARIYFDERQKQGVLRQLRKKVLYFRRIGTDEALQHARAMEMMVDDIEIGEWDLFVVR